MIAWWWLLVGFAVLTVLAAALDDRVRESVGILLAGVVGVVLSPLVWLVARADVGALPLSPRALERFAGARRGNDQPAWVFWARGSGVILVRKWKPNTGRRKVELSPQWRSRRSDPIKVRDEAR